MPGTLKDLPLLVHRERQRREANQLYVAGRQLFRKSHPGSECHDFLGEYPVPNAISPPSHLIHARDYFEQALRLYPRHEAAWNFLAVCLIHEGQHSRAETLLRRLLVGCENEWVRTQARVNLLTALARQDKQAAAVTLARGHTQSLLFHLMGAWNLVCCTAVTGDVKLMHRAGRALESHALRQPEFFLRLREGTWREGSLATALQQPAIANSLVSICPSLFGDRQFWNLGMRRFLEIFWPSVEKRIRRAGHSLSAGDREDWLPFCALQLVRDLQAGRFDPDKGSFLGWLHSWLPYRRKDWQRKARQPVASREGHFREPWEGQDALGESMETPEEMDLLQKIPWARGRRILKETAVEGKSRSEIARDHSLSEREVSNWIRRVRYYLRARVTSPS